MDGEKQRANDNDRYVLAAQPGQVAGAANKDKPALEAHRPKRPARLRSPRKPPVPDRPTVRAGAGQQPSEHEFHAPTRRRLARSDTRSRRSHEAQAPPRKRRQGFVGAQVVPTPSRAGERAPSGTRRYVSSAP